MSDTLDTPEAAADANIVRMYKTDDDGVMVFREAWVDAGDGEDDGEVYFVLNHGPVGQQSTSKDAEAGSLEEAHGMLAAFAEQCIADGYAELSRDEQSTVVAQFALKNARVTDRDKYLQEKALEALTAHLAWRGSGVVEKSEFVEGPHNTGKLNIYILSPDAARTVANVKVCVREHKLDFTKLSIGVAPANDLSAIKARHSPSGGTAFSL
ncbi:hypothetical protein AL755_08865 [Arthrobacter sp. ERGS1:01]|uniref:hypothetical protein n=1 Tax=Arthrobacter sp. ERGS1:01 TaxID=1704044 RepID=UPI0006B52C9B|nr:hypothetical protein [Arthrobacter sp. ERGS1:01]ALE05570.1 hypothetical protein AL755_08865 [Arthrobacter sp. ERGS1:01]